MDHSQDVPLTETGLSFHPRLENQSGGKRDTRELYERHFVVFCSTSVMGDKLAGEAQV